MRNIRYTFASLALAATLFATAASAQTEGSTQQSIERKKMESLWFSSTNNAAGAQLDKIDYFSQLGINYNHTEGDFQRTQLGTNNNGYGFSTDGGGIFDNLKGAFMWGYFNYSHDKIHGARYNASLIDPLRGMPFYLADTNVSNWIHQNYELGMKAATPVIGGHWIFGAGLDYQNMQGAKQIDPRPNVQMSKVVITPSIVFTAGKHAVGADYTYSSRREDGTATNSISLMTQPVWEVVAPGFYNTAEIGSGSFSGLRVYNANAMGGGVQYSFTGEKVKILLSGDYLFSVEDVNNNYTTPKIIGTTKENLWEAKAKLHWSINPTHSLFASVEYYNRSIDGIEYIQVWDNTYEVSQWIVISKNIRSNFSTKRTTAKVDYMKNRGNSYSWMAGIELQNEKLADIYYLPRSTQDVENYYLTLYAKKNFFFGKNTILVGVNAGYKSNESGEISYSGNYAESDIYKNMVLRDYYYLSQSAILGGAELGYTRSGLFNSRSSLFINAKFSCAAPESDKWATPDGHFEFKDFSALIVKAGFTF